MNERLLLLLITSFILPHSFSQSKPLPVIDMHLHAEPVKKRQGAPLCIGAPFRDLGINDPANDYRKVFDAALRTNAWATRWLPSAGTADSLRLLTIAAMKKNNVYGVTSGDPGVPNQGPFVFRKLLLSIMF
jgi:hypothetical protein